MWAAKQFLNKHLDRSHQRTTNDDRLLHYDIWNNVPDFIVYNLIADEINTSYLA